MNQKTQKLANYACAYVEHCTLFASLDCKRSKFKRSLVGESVFNENEAKTKI